jgi:hypothetical protein
VPYIEKEKRLNTAMYFTDLLCTANSQCQAQALQFLFSLAAQAPARWPIACLRLLLALGSVLFQCCRPALP